MKTHELKILDKYFEQIENGSKKYEIRKNDRDFEVGDILILNEKNEELGCYTGNCIVCVIKSILKNFEGLADGYVIMSLSKKIIVKY